MPVRLYGATSGYVDIAVPDVADNGTVTLSPSAVSPGLVLIRKESFSGVASKSIDGVFTSQYKNYRIVFDGVFSANAYLRVRMRAASADATASNYKFGITRYTHAGAYASYSNAADTTWQVGAGNTNEYTREVFDFFSPALAAHTSFTVVSSDDGAGGAGGGRYQATTSFDGLTFYPSTGTFSGDIYVYGYAETVGDYPQLNQVPGLSLVTTASFTTQASVSIDDCFTSDYDNYRIILKALGSTTAQGLTFRLRASGVDDSTASSYTRIYAISSTTTITVNTANGNSAPDINAVSSASPASSTIDLLQPAAAAATTGLVNGWRPEATQSFHQSGFWHNVTSAFDGFTIYPASGTITGSIAVYGYRKA